MNNPVNDVCRILHFSFFIFHSFYVSYNLVPAFAAKQIRAAGAQMNVERLVVTAYVLEVASQSGAREPADEAE